MNIELAKKNDITSIIEILKQRCDWFRENNIKQWTDDYYIDRYNFDYFSKEMNINKLYVVRINEEIVGVFLLKDEDKTYWNDNKNAYYIHHLATKVQHKGLGKKILKFIVDLAKENGKMCIRIDCMKNNEKLNKYYLSKGFVLKGSGEVPYKHNLLEMEMR